ncbi:deoxyribonuclease-2-alpha-like [Boleophthalmus pectinirostris]|uniref:deoxyribonuclease-2-alpha-like n=1 Tax=Boleophthalmus pectinirostris TaxID=150288 RepID=UPI000A1C284C|nr:deoxyribonuclease-2-alpha-like [Boleophthalmus pectinirostris]
MALTRIWRLLLCLGTLQATLGQSNVACRNDRGEEVDWYILYKLPKSKGDGLNYLYMDERTQGWRESVEKINSPKGSMANTLTPLFDYYKKKTEGFGFMLYNDQPPKGLKPAPASFGHAKGVVMLNKTSGVWLAHSTPQFPSYQSEMFWPSSGTNNAQTFFCVTYAYSEFKKIGVHLKYIHAFPFDSVFPTYFYDELKCVAQRSCYPKAKPWFKVTELISLKGHHFKSFAKYTRFNDDLYAGLIVNFTKQNIYVKSWGSMRQPLPSNCTQIIPHFVYNIKEVNPHRKGSFPDTVDHSKWCVTATGDFTCVADMNREVSQMGRGGGAVCTDDTNVGEAFLTAVYKTQPCDDPQLPAENGEHNDKK